MLHIERLGDRTLFLQGDVHAAAAGEVEAIHGARDMPEVARDGAVRRPALTRSRFHASLGSSVPAKCYKARPDPKT
jgi:hypothetical protein